MKHLAAWFFTATLVMHAATLLAAPVPLIFWHSTGGDKLALLNGFVAAFNDTPEVKGRYVVVPQFVGTYEESLNKLRAALMAGDSPHLAQIYDIGTAVLLDSGAARPLQDFVDRDPTFPLGMLLPQVTRYYSAGGRLQALPFATSNPILYYNADLLQKAGLTRPPANLDEVAQWATRLTDPAHHVVGLTWPLTSWLYEEFLARCGLELLSPSNGRGQVALHANIDNPFGRTYFHTLLKMTQQGAFANLGRAWDPAEQAFLAGRAAMLVTSTSDVFFLAKSAPFAVKTAPIAPLTGHAQGGTVIGGSALWVMRQKPEAEQQAAYQFLRFIASKAVQRQWHTRTGYFPIRSDVILDLEREGFYKEHPQSRPAIDQMLAAPATAASQGAVSGVFTELRDYIETATEEILAETKTPEEALARANQRADKALARYQRLTSRPP